MAINNQYTLSFLSFYIVLSLRIKMVLKVIKAKFIISLSIL